MTVAVKNVSPAPWYDSGFEVCPLCGVVRFFAAVLFFSSFLLCVSVCVSGCRRLSVSCPAAGFETGFMVWLRFQISLPL